MIAFAYIIYEISILDTFIIFIEKLINITLNLYTIISFLCQI